MSINFLDTYVIIFSLVQYSVPIVLKLPKSYTSRYIKKPSKTTLYVNNPYKARKNFDYNYEDWEKKQTDIYDYMLPSTNQSSTEFNINNETSPKDIFSSEIPRNPILESSQYNTLYSSSATYPTLPSNESTSDTSLPTPSIDPAPLSILPSSFTPYNTRTTTLTPEVIYSNIIIETTPSETQIVPDNQSIRNELLDAKNMLETGFFTSSIYVLLKIIERKKSEDVTSLLAGLQGEFTRLNSNHHLAMFGPLVNSVFTFMVLKMTTVPVEFIQKQAKYGQELLETRRVALDLDVLAGFEIVDTIYKEEDYNRTLDSLTDIQNFPDVSKSAMKVAEEAMAAYILLPYSRIIGSSKEKLLQTELQNIVEKRMFLNEQRIIRRYFGNHAKITTEMTASSENIAKFRGKKFTKVHMGMKFTWPTIFTEPTTINSPETEFTSYVTDPQIMKQLRRKMINYKKRIRKLKSQESRLKKTRRMTSTTTTTTTRTMMPLKRKSKYYVRKNIYKMKTTTPKTTKFLWTHLGKFKTKKINDFKKENMNIENFDVKKYPSSNDASDSKGYYSDSMEDDYKTDANDFTRSISPTKLKSLNRFKTIKNYITNHMLHNNNIIEGEESKMAIEHNNIIEKFDNNRDSSDSNGNAYLQVNLNDALFHTSNITIDRRFITKKVNKLLKMDSFSDDEAILKGNIYKVFGYSNDFAKQLRTML